MRSPQTPCAVQCLIGREHGVLRSDVVGLAWGVEGLRVQMNGFLHPQGLFVVGTLVEEFEPDLILSDVDAASAVQTALIAGIEP
jgi:hypothetical protein